VDHIRPRSTVDRTWTIALSSLESGWDGALAHRCSPTAAEKGEGEVTNLIGTSPWSRRRQDGQAMVVKAAAGRAPMHKGVGQGAGEGEGSAGDPFQASMKVGRWRKSQAVMVKAVAGRTLMRVRSGLRIGARRSGGEVVRGGDAGVTFYRVGGGAGRPGDGGEWAVVVGRHDGGGGDRFDRGSPGVVGSDEGCPGHFGSGRGGFRRMRARTHKVVVVASAVLPR
jgi:hypothetical protein